MRNAAVTVRLVSALIATAAIIACNSTVDVLPAPATIQLTSTQEASLDSIGRAIKQGNPTDPTLQSLVDSTLLVLHAGVEAKRVDITTDLTTAPLYFVGVHRAVSRQSGSFSTWTLVGFDSFSSLSSLVEVSGFAQNGTATAPSSVSASIGDGSGFVNGMLLQVGTNGVVTTYRATGGAVGFSSTAGGAACPGTMPANVTCTLETMHVHFTLSGAAKTASQPVDVDVPALRLVYSAP
jgi:hypothetical protein